MAQIYTREARKSNPLLELSLILKKAFVPFVHVLVTWDLMDQCLMHYYKETVIVNSNYYQATHFEVDSL